MNNEFLNRYFGISVEEVGLIVTVISTVVTLGTLTVIIWRKVGLSGLATFVQDLAGLTRRKYDRWFLREYGTIRDIYLNKNQKLDLTSTYISLSFEGRTETDQPMAADQRVLATHVLSNVDERRIIITGDPGTGKSALLKAYGAGVLRANRRRDGSDLIIISPSSEVPFLVPLRRFGRHADGIASLSRYLVDDILAKAQIKDGRSFLRAARIC